MKRPALFLTVMFVAIIGSTALVSTAISGICRSFKTENNKSFSIKEAPAEKQANDEFKQASVKL